MQLYLLRHGDAIDSGGDDIRRPLSALGKEQAEIVGELIVRSKIFLDIIVTSPFERARRTGEIIGEVVHVNDISTTEYLIPGASERQLIEHLNAAGKHSVLLVGHEPQLRSFLSYVTTGSRNTIAELRKASLACVNATPALDAGSGVLRWLLTVEQMSLMLKGL